MSDETTMLIVPGEISKVGLVLPPETSYEDWKKVGLQLDFMQRTINWMIGDWLLFGERKYGDRYSQHMEFTGWKYERLANVVSVCKRVPVSVRKENLSWTMHAAVAKFPPAEQVEWLDRAEAEGWGSKELRQAIKDAQRPSNRDVSAGDEPSPAAGPQAEAAHAGTGTGTPAGHEGHSASGAGHADGAAPVVGAGSPAPMIAHHPDPTPREALIWAIEAVDDETLAEVWETHVRPRIGISLLRNFEIGSVIAAPAVRPSPEAPREGTDSSAADYFDIPEFARRTV